MAISDHTRRALWGQSGGVCARCRNTLIQGASPLDREALVGEEAHIVSRAAAGPRHGSEPNGGYDGLANLILLCRVCHALVDAQSATYPADALRALRDSHVEWVKTRVGRAQSLPQLRFSPIPADLELTLIASGQQLVDLLSGTEDVAFRHDQPRNGADAELMSELLKRVGEMDMEIDAIGPHHAVDLSHDFQEILLEQLLPAGIIVLGARAQRTVRADEARLPWTTCVLSIRYAPQQTEAHGSERSAGAQASPGDLGRKLQALLAEGRVVRDKARISDDGTSAVIEIWERDVRRALDGEGRHDLMERFDSADRRDLAKVVSGSWATKRRLARELAVVTEFVGELGRRA